MSSTFSTFAIYESPSDYPGKFVVREWNSSSGSQWAVPGPATVCDTLKEARTKMPRGLTRMERMEHDDPCILETWL